ncbi:hypothetical protein FBU30_003399 [Linnemannia zychae]|nr:hypothetical protein FBU30_003399 [Linnemannia zychae]
MTAQETNYVILEYISITLFLFLIGHCAYKRINFTLQIFSIAAIFNNINESFLLIKYGDWVQTMAKGTSGCICSAVFEQLVPLTVSSLAACMGFNIWYLIVLRTKKTEKEMLKWYCLVSFGGSAILTMTAVILLRNDPYFSAYPRKYYCDLGGSYVTRWTFAVPMLITALVGILCSVHTVIYLVRHVLKMRRTLNGTSSAGNLAFELGFGILVLMAVLDSVVDNKSRQAEYNSSEELSTYSDFSGSLVGIVIFIIFGTTKESFRTFMKLVGFVREWLGNCWCWITGSKSTKDDFDDEPQSFGKTMKRVFCCGGRRKRSNGWDQQEKGRSESTSPIKSSLSGSSGSITSSRGTATVGKTKFDMESYKYQRQRDGGRRHTSDVGLDSFDEIMYGVHNSAKLKVPESNTPDSFDKIMHGSYNNDSNGKPQTKRNEAIRPRQEYDYNLESAFTPAGNRPLRAPPVTAPVSRPLPPLPALPLPLPREGGEQRMSQIVESTESPALKMLRSSATYEPSPPVQSYLSK